MITSWSGVCAAVGILLLAAMITADANNTELKDLHQLAVPTIRPSLREIILQSGENYTLFCSGASHIQFKHQDVPEEITSDFNTSERILKNDESGYEVALDLVNVDRFAVGYYACFDDSVNASDVLANVIEEPQNTPHASYIYIYVNGTSMFAPMRAFVITKGNSTFLIECRPTAPDIKVDLVPQSNKKPFYEKFSPKIGFVFARAPKSTEYRRCVMRRGTDNSSIHIRNNNVTPPEPHIFLDSQYFLDGETFSIHCTVKKKMNSAVELIWRTPGSTAKVSHVSNEHSVGDVLFNNITVRNASKEDAGYYICVSKNGHNTLDVNVEKVHLEKPKIEMSIKNQQSQITQKVTRMIRVAVDVYDYPPADIVFLKNGERIPEDVDKKCVVVSLPKKPNVHYNDKKKCTILLRNLKLEDMGNYTVKATNKYNLTNSSTFDIRVSAPPELDFGHEDEKSFLLNTQASFLCKATGYPVPNIKWIFTTDDDTEREIDGKYQNDTLTSLYSIESYLTIPVRTAGNITCRATNINKSIESTKRFIVYEIPNGFGIKKEQTWLPENQYVELKCLASIFDFENLTWYGPGYSDMENVEYTENALSYVAKLKMERISLSQAGTYTCIGIRLNGNEENDTITIAVEGTREPAIEDVNGEGKDEVEVIPFQPVNFTCTANAVPPPTIEWFKDGIPVENSTKVQILINNPEHSYRNSTLIITEMNEEYVGKYECRATSLSKTNSRTYNLFLKENATYKKTYLGIIGATTLLLLGLVAYLAWKIREEKEFRKELAAAGLLNFKEGAAKSINPDVGIDEQAELLPYDEKFEFPAECLKLGKQLGAGAFGVVYKAEARGIIDAEKTTTVAVKMVKKTADNMYIKALASELKIMVHLGKHVNIVNLLGACTKNVGKRELIVIVEYCKFGNIHNYMQKHREVFIDQLNDNPEKHMGKINKGYSSSSGNSGMHSDYGSNHTQDTDHTLLNTANTNRSSRKQSETGYVQPEWRSNYESDYSFDGRSPRPLYTRDLLAWAFQIARGMEYLANRKVLHGDLAARNVLLADDNIVKICDFGLARSIYKNDEYQKQENSPLPVKWLAIECMTDRIFSTQSDVWSFGIVLWELFSLAKTPYPNVSPPSLLQRLREGERLEKPAYADDRIYALMRNCWEEKPTKRPTFTELQTTLGSFLEDTVRNHYVDLDAAYTDMNTKKAGEEDYLAMVNAPDYNNLVTPSPHHYVNEGNFFPPNTNQHHEDEGYLPMSPGTATRQNLFNARVQGNKFDFDARKLTPRVSDNSYGESTPMLDLNSLPRSGSESDHEGHSPATHGAVCPRIDEEADEVFIENSKNTQPNSITNPTYITMSPGSEKKSHNFANNYINVKIPNGLVK